MRIPDYTISEFKGLNTVINDIATLDKGVSPDSLNWITGKFKDNISLRRGQALLGQTRVDGSGKITGLGVGTKYNGSQVPFFSYGRKVKYYNVTTDDTVEVGSDLLPTGADGEDVWFTAYQNLAGSFMYLGGQNSSVYKIPVPNPGSAVDQSVNNYRFGILKVSQNRSFAGQRNGTTPGNQDKTGVYLSYVDKALLSSYTQVTGEAFGTGDGDTKTFAETLNDITGVRTAMYVSVTDGTETFIDDRNGNMVGNLGGTGTVNYATGAVSVTFNTAPANLQAITCSYYHETATSEGILDFTGTSFGQGASFRQDDGGGTLMAIWPVNNVEYCFHLLKTWQLTMATSSSETSTNLPYRTIGVKYSQSAYPTPEGVLFADLSRPTDPKFRRLQIAPNTTNLTIEPTPISDSLDLSPHAFDYCVAFRWGDYEIFCVQDKINGVANNHNSIMYVHNVISDTWDKLDYYASRLAEYEGTLIAGDSLSNNVMTLFSGFDDDGSVIGNYWTDGDMNLGTDHLKIVHRMVINGLIQTDQSVKVSLSYDGAPFTEVFTIEGDGDYVDSGINTSIGSQTLGSGTIGGGAEATAHPFIVDFPIHSPKFQTVRIKFEAQAIGAVEIDEYTYKDIRDKGQKILNSNTII